MNMVHFDLLSEGDIDPIIVEELLQLKSGFEYCDLILIIQFNMNHLFAHC